MKQKPKCEDGILTPWEFEETLESLEVAEKFKQIKERLRTLLDRKSNAEIQANIREYESYHTMDGVPVSEETYRALNAALIRRGPYGALLNPNNRTNQKIL